MPTAVDKGMGGQGKWSRGFRDEERSQHLGLFSLGKASKQGNNRVRNEQGGENGEGVIFLPLIILAL